MPFLEIFDFEATRSERQNATELATQSLCETFEVTPDIISAYFFNIGDDSYAHCGVYTYASDTKRIFVKVHAFRRPLDTRRKAARKLTDALAKAYGVPEKNIAIYFFDQDMENVAHAGILASDL